MKIAIDCRYIGKSGIGTYIENVVNKILAEHAEHQYLFICEKGNRLAKNKDAEILETDIQPFSLSELMCFPVSQINKCDAYFSPYINIPGGIEIPVYSTIHDVVFFDVKGLVSPFGAFVRRFYYKRAIRLSKKIFTVSEFSRERILYHFPTDKEIVVTGNGISKTIEESQTTEVENKDFYLFVGNIKRHKGLQTLVRAFELARNKGLKSRLVIVGNSEKFRTRDKELATILNRSSSVEFTGWVTNEQLIKLITEAKALIQPSLYEGFGIPPLEALYLGTNAIISDIPVFKEVYAELPVTFFRVGDVEDLADKLFSYKADKLPAEIRTEINKRYSYKKVVNTILKNIAINMSRL